MYNANTAGAFDTDICRRQQLPGTAARGVFVARFTGYLKPVLMLPLHAPHVRGHGIPLKRLAERRRSHTEAIHTESIHSIDDLTERQRYRFLASLNPHALLDKQTVAARLVPTADGRQGRLHSGRETRGEGMSTHAALQECPCISGSAKKFSQGPDLVTRELESLRSCRPSQIIRLHSVVTSARGFKECFN
ncbi:hypothetical protein LSAT2_007397, partial [Lamellibrachia satsuma]